MTAYKLFVYVAWGLMAVGLIWFMVAGLVRAIRRPERSELVASLNSISLWAWLAASAIGRRYRESRHPPEPIAGAPTLTRPVGVVLAARKGAVAAATILLFAAVFVAVAAGEDVLVLHLVPIALVALLGGALAGLAAAAIALLLTWLGIAAAEETLGLVDYGALGALFLLVGILAGLFRDRALGSWLGIPILTGLRRAPGTLRDPPSRKRLAEEMKEGLRHILLAFFILLVLIGALLGEDPEMPDPGWTPLEASTDVRIDLAASRLNPNGEDDAADEYICLVNRESQPVDLRDWRLTDMVVGAKTNWFDWQAKNIQGLFNVLPAFTLPPGAEVRVHPGEGRDSAHDLFGEDLAQWANDDEQITLLDSAGQLVDSRAAGTRAEGDGGSCQDGGS